MGQVEKRLQELGIQLPELVSPKGSYVLFKQVGDLIFVSCQSAFQGEEALYPGRVGAEVTVEQAREAACETGKLILAILQQAAGTLDRIEIVKVTGYVASTPEFSQQPLVMNALSDLFSQILGERGRHVRATIATSNLAFHCCVEAETVARLLP